MHSYRLLLTGNLQYIQLEHKDSGNTSDLPRHHFELSVATAASYTITRTAHNLSLDFLITLMPVAVQTRHSLFEGNLYYASACDFPYLADVFRVGSL